MLIFPQNSPFEPRIEASLTAMVGYDVRLQVTGLLADPRVSVVPRRRCRPIRLCVGHHRYRPSRAENMSAASGVVPFIVKRFAKPVPVPRSRCRAVFGIVSKCF